MRRLFLQPCCFPESICPIGLLPGKALVFAPEVPVGSGLAVDGAAQIQIADDSAGAQVEVFADQLGDVFIGDLARAEGLDVDRERVRHANGVGHLDLAALRQPGSHHVLGDPAAGVGCGAIHLRGILAAESTTAVPAHAAVGIDDDLAPGDPGVAHRSADDELAGGVDEHLGGGTVEQFLWQHRVDDILHDALGDVGVADGVSVLGADEHRIHAQGFAESVLDGDLAFAVGAHPG